MPRAEGTVYLYAGPLIDHYGHFICTSLNRLWFLLEHGLPEGAKVLFQTHDDLEQLWQREYIRTCLTALGLRFEHLVRFDTPVSIDNLIVPWPAFQEQNYGCTIFRDTCLAIGDAMRNDGRLDRPVYLTKSGLKSGVWSIAGEEAIEQEMVKLGFEVIRPETLSFADQLAIFESANPIIGPAGSALHTHVFTRGQGAIVGLTAGDQLISNFRLLDSLTGRRTVYVSTVETPQHVPTPHFNELVSFGKPEMLAQALVAQAQRS